MNPELRDWNPPCVCGHPMKAHDLQSAPEDRCEGEIPPFPCPCDRFEIPKGVNPHPPGSYGHVAYEASRAMNDLGRALVEAGEDFLRLARRLRPKG